METDDECTCPATDILTQRTLAIQSFGGLVPLPLALHESARKQSVENLNLLFADKITLRALLKRLYMQVSRPAFYQLHLLFDKHSRSQAELIDTLAECTMTLDGICTAMALGVSDETIISRQTRDREYREAQLTQVKNAEDH
jgi:starvation-inducible DNA-binding protein